MKVLAFSIFLVSTTVYASNTWVVEAKDDATKKVTNYVFNTPGVHPFNPEGFKKVTCDIVLGSVEETSIDKIKSQVISIVCRNGPMSFSNTIGCAVPPHKIEKGVPKGTSMVREGEKVKYFNISCK